MTRLVICDWTRKVHSEGARALKNEIDGMLVRRTSEKFNGRDAIVINWGCPNLPDWRYRPIIINHPDAVNRASNKRRYFKHLEHTNYTPLFTQSIDKARMWADEGPVVCRTKLFGHSGAGIVIANVRVDVVDAPLYVLYVPKKQEYRVHVFDGEIIGLRRKARKRAVPDAKVNWQIRAEKNGFVYVNEFDAPWRKTVTNKAGPMCIDVVRKLGLTFGAIDVLWNERDDRYYALEVNTAPGIEGGSVKNYGDAVKKFVTKL